MSKKNKSLKEKFEKKFVGGNKHGGYWRLKGRKPKIVWKFIQQALKEERSKVVEVLKKAKIKIPKHFSKAFPKHESAYEGYSASDCKACEFEEDNRATKYNKNLDRIIDSLKNKDPLEKLFVSKEAGEIITREVKKGRDEKIKTIEKVEQACVDGVRDGSVNLSYILEFTHSLKKK